MNPKQLYGDPNSDPYGFDETDKKGILTAYS